MLLHMDLYYYYYYYYNNKSVIISEIPASYHATRRRVPRQAPSVLLAFRFEEFAILLIIDLRSDLPK